MNSVQYVHGSSSPIKHGFFKRHGGVSNNQFTSLNATARVGDSEANARENRKRICASLNVSDDSLVFLDYLPHGSEAFFVDKSNAGTILNNADAIVTTEANLPIAIAVADCNPILITDNTSFIALVHSGWRGTKANIVERTIEAITEKLNVQPQAMVAVIGPSIASQDYPVTMEVARYFDAKYLRKIDDETEELDLWTAVEDQLANAGVGNIENLKINTYKNPDFYSYREDAGDTGRFMAIAQL